MKRIVALNPSACWDHPGSLQKCRYLGLAQTECVSTLGEPPSVCIFKASQVTLWGIKTTGEGAREKLPFSKNHSLTSLKGFRFHLQQLGSLVLLKLSVFRDNQGKNTLTRSDSTDGVHFAKGNERWGEKETEKQIQILSTIHLPKVDEMQEGWSREGLDHPQDLGNTEMLEEPTEVETSAPPLTESHKYFEGLLCSRQFTN